MSEFAVRPLAEGEQRPAFDVLSQSLHGPVSTDERWAKRAEGFPAERKFGAFEGGTVIGVTSSIATGLTVPGGATLPSAAVDGVGVRADHTRRGVLTALMAEQLADCAARGEVLAHLHASETTIYGRFGYAVATRGKTLRILKGRARFRDDAPSGGRVRLVGTDAAKKLIPELYERIAPHRPGMMIRPPVWWNWARDGLVGENFVAVHTGPDGDDGFVLYHPQDRRSFEQPEAGAALVVRDLHAANPGALAGLWRFLCRVDLVGEVRAPDRPLDDPIGLMLTDPRACEVLGLEDSTWLRLVDVPAALAARTYRPAAPVVLEVTDPLLPANSGRYRVAPEGATRTEEPAGLALGVDTLAMIYLGDRAPSLLAALNRIEVRDPAALPEADALFATATAPWCGTPF
ncbi:GNAT family N-acetyltransferase [Amycolatopsis cynarae]|uniref:GNAT family N-acetyltransferase n=1 Tax=Amycolatopsis cynarae TaxID=2995223 RepID=A0ABY7AUV7_9PSEU|nr:GNAT family N-acetyltransferase [Amycolatopsis sp. HUAS 11-8]WAL63303.1 GNAT family N-acetyltransferase [Amycolatopsis sp. HUAS 11-8]